MTHRVFDWCVCLLQRLAAVLGLSYEEVNVLLFCVCGPLVLVLLCLVIVAQRQVIGEQERQFQNFCIQSTVADAVSAGLYNLYWYRESFSPDELDYRILLQIHDAVLLEVPVRFVERVYD